MYNENGHKCLKITELDEKNKKETVDYKIQDTNNQNWQLSNIFW